MTTFRLMAMVLLMLGCAEEMKPGTLNFEWRLGSQGCEHYEVDTVESALFGFQSVEPAFEAGFQCDDLNGVISGVSPGEYSLVVTGLDGDGCPTHEARTDVVIGSGANVTLERPLGLYRKQRPLELTWNFGNRLDCFANDISQVEILVESDDEDSFTEVRSCEGFVTSLQVDSPAVALSVTVFGVNDTGERTHFGSLSLARAYFLEEPCEPVLRTLVVLEACSQTNCSQ